MQRLRTAGVLGFAPASSFDPSQATPSRTQETSANEDAAGALFVTALVGSDRNDCRAMALTAMGILDSRVHFEVMRFIVDRGFAPTVAELAAIIDVSAVEIEESERRLHENHALVLHPGTSDVWIAHPFSLSPTAVWVAAGDRGWWAPCLWCAAGIVALCAPNATIHTRLGGESTEIAIAVRDGRVLDDDLLVHFSVAPRNAWSNVVHFCASALPFRTTRDVDAWCARHRAPRGAAMNVTSLLLFGRAWYGQHLDEHWRKWTVSEAQAIFKRCELRGPFWKLPSSEGTF